MKRIIQSHDLIPLKKEIEHINEVNAKSPLTFEYIDFIEKQNLPFGFKKLPYQEPFNFNSLRKNEFIQQIKKNNYGFFEFKDNDYKKITAEYFLDTFVGKEFNELEKFFLHSDFRIEICEFYRSFGLIALSRKEKKLYRELIKPFYFNEKYDLGLILYQSNLPYLLKYHNELFHQYDMNFLFENWIKIVNSFEKYKLEKSKYNHNTGNSFYAKAQSFTLKLAGNIIFKQGNQSIENLITEYEDILSQKTVYEFFRDNKCEETKHAYYIYRKHIESYKKSEILIESVDLLQKNLSLDINSVMNKHLLNYDKCSHFIKEIVKFFQSEKDFQYTLLSFNDENKKCTISLTSNNSNFLKNGQEFLSQILNDKDLFMNPDKYKSCFYHIHFSDKFEAKEIKSKTIKI